MATTIRIRSNAGPYDVFCARGSFAKLRPLVARLGDATGLYVLSSPRVWKFWGSTVARRVGVNAKHVILFDDSESRKRLATIEEIARKLTRAGADRRCILLAVGGGVVGDVAGFAAATYLRGVRIVHVPTTLVAQVDSAIGGKTGVDLPEGKNLVGAFHPPQLVVVDPELLRTLPQREYRSGLYEVVKYGIIADAKLFDFLEKHMDELLRRDAAALDRVIPRCIAIKAAVVNADEHESGLRKILNYGHTLGHAFEAATHYKRFLHGEAIGWGMIAATLLSVQAFRLPLLDCFRILRIIWRIGPLPALPTIRSGELRELLVSDKKTRGREVGWVLANRIGQTEWDIRLPDARVRKTVDALPQVMVELRRTGGEPILGIIQGPSNVRGSKYPSSRGMANR
ncbi:MAG TPA: 3-dehydroquinate synthase [Candidatus Acidoferrum sp.]|nr:3-dehydroquinate synthase [Candidatus Acidoferrum sp.]